MVDATLGDIARVAGWGPVVFMLIGGMTVGYQVLALIDRVIAYRNARIRKHCPECKCSWIGGPKSFCHTRDCSRNPMPRTR